jgi:hypothetical protein
MKRDTTKPAADVADAKLFGDWFESRFELEPLAGKAQVHGGAQRIDRRDRAKRLVDRAPGDALAHVGHRDGTAEMVGDHLSADYPINRFCFQLRVGITAALVIMFSQLIDQFVCIPYVPIRT